MPGTPPPSSSAAAKQAEAERAKKAEADRAAEAECVAQRLADEERAREAKAQRDAALARHVLLHSCLTGHQKLAHLDYVQRMVTGISEEYVIPSLENMDPSILELRRMSKAALSLWVMMAQVAFVCVLC
ncbi:hypothetical protein ACP70R_023501 [Stipagrostis hirtigluma subsp. patula]